MKNSHYNSLIFLMIFLIIPSEIFSQQTFNPNNILIASKEDARRGLMRSGQLVKCKLDDGSVLKGKLYIYSDHIEVDQKRVAFYEIKMIKPVNAKFLSSQVSNITINELVRRETNSNIGAAYWVSTGIGFGLGLILFNRKFKPKKGWYFTVQELQAINFRRRA